MIQRYFVVHLHNDLLMASCTAVLYDGHTDWRAPEMLRHIPVRKKHEKNRVIMKNCKLESVNSLWLFSILRRLLSLLLGAQRVGFRLHESNYGDF